MTMRAYRAFHRVQVSWEVLWPAIGGSPPNMHGSAFYRAAWWLSTIPQSIQLLFRSGMYGTT